MLDNIHGKREIFEATKRDKQSLEEQTERLLPPRSDAGCQTMLVSGVVAETKIHERARNAIYQCLEDGLDNVDLS
jgi:hypothetical protein